MKKQSFLKIAVLGVALVISGCGKETFSPTASSSAATGHGEFSVPPKVDILMVEDNSGSADEIQSQLESQMSSFLTSLQSTGWDYHFSAAPLVNAQPFSQITASHYDPNWGSQWVSPFPGANPSYIEQVNSNYFVFPQSFSAFISPGGTSGSIEPGLATLLTTLNNEAPGTGFIRPDALLVVVALSNGNDTSGVNYCNYNGTAYNGSGVPYPCGQVGNPTCNQFPPENSTCDSWNTSLKSYQQQLINYKGAKSLVQFNAIVNTNTQCASSNYIGSRYSWMASNLSGQTFDICSGQATNVLSSLSSTLQSIKLNYRTHYLFVSTQPDPSTIVVTKYPNGDTSNPQVLSQSATNGWTYVGYQTVDTIDWPVPMDQATGYAIQLNGSAELSGNDTATVTYTAAGLHGSN